MVNGSYALSLGNHFRSNSLETEILKFKKQNLSLAGFFILNWFLATKEAVKYNFGLKYLDFSAF